MWRCLDIAHVKNDEVCTRIIYYIFIFQPLEPHFCSHRPELELLEAKVKEDQKKQEQELSSFWDSWPIRSKFATMTVDPSKPSEDKYDGVNRHSIPGVPSYRTSIESNVVSPTVFKIFEHLYNGPDFPHPFTPSRGEWCPHLIRC